jgi:hypothetical protein
MLFVALMFAVLGFAVAAFSFGLDSRPQKRAHATPVRVPAPARVVPLATVRPVVSLWIGGRRIATGDVARRA